MCVHVVELELDWDFPKTSLTLQLNTATCLWRDSLLSAGVCMLRLCVSNLKSRYRAFPCSARKVSQPRPSLAGEKPFECRLCSQRSRDYSAMIKHLRTHGEPPLTSAPSAWSTATAWPPCRARQIPPCPGTSRRTGASAAPTCTPPTAETRTAPAASPSTGSTRSLSGCHGRQCTLQKKIAKLGIAGFYARVKNAVGSFVYGVGCGCERERWVQFDHYFDKQTMLCHIGRDRSSTNTHTLQQLTMFRTHFNSH